MAKRTIRARRASPYLLYLVIAFSVLTVVCAVGWGWTWSVLNQDRLSTFPTESLLNAAGGAQELYKQIFDKYPGTGATLSEILENRNKLNDEYRSEIQRLTERLVNNPFSTQQGDQLRQSVSYVLNETNDLLTQASATIAKSYQVDKEGTGGGEVKPTSLKDAVRALSQRVDAMVLQIKQDGTAAGTLQTQIKGLQGELEAAKTEFKRQSEQLDANLKDEKGRLTAARDSALAQSKTFEEEKQKAMDRLIAERKAWYADRDKIQQQMSALSNNLKDMAEVVKKFRAVPTETGIDGRIVSVAEQGGVAYADLGKKDGVLLGMPFSIFSPRDLGKTNPQPKAQCRIVKIMPDACELRIYEIAKDSPVVTGDVLVNPVYDRERRLRFVLVGRMDIHGDGTDSTEQLKALIQEFGGRLDPQLTVQTDYLVVGEEPTIPAAPAVGASPMERQGYEDARKRFIDYTEAKAKAENFSIPILSLNRFMGLVGLAGKN